MGKLHLVMYSQGEPFDTSKRKMIESIRNCTSREVVCHSYDLHRIRGCEWFKHMEVVSKIHGHVAGGIGTNIWNGLSEPDGTRGVCNIIEVWNAILPQGNNHVYMDLYHVCASWFVFKKTELISSFMKDWVYYCMLTTNELPYPLITYHHTVDQSIFNILVVKYNMIVFFDEDLNHREVKNRNRVMKSINAAHVTKRQFFKRILDTRTT